MIASCGLFANSPAVVIGAIHDDLPLTEEILDRTSPDLADLVIALAGGAAGAYATVSPYLSVAFVGGAIATALVPPLCAANMLFTRGEIALESGRVGSDLFVQHEIWK